MTNVGPHQIRVLYTVICNCIVPFVRVKKAAMRESNSTAYLRCSYLLALARDDSGGGLLYLVTSLELYLLLERIYHQHDI